MPIIRVEGKQNGSWKHDKRHPETVSGVHELTNQRRLGFWEAGQRDREMKSVSDWGQNTYCTLDFYLINFFLRNIFFVFWFCFFFLLVIKPRRFPVHPMRWSVPAVSYATLSIGKIDGTFATSRTRGAWNSSNYPTSYSSACVLKCKIVSPCTKMDQFHWLITFKWIFFFFLPS